MYAIDFKYDNRKLSDFNMMIGQMNGSGGSDIASSGADIEFNQIQPSGSDFFNLYSSAYQSPFTAAFQIIKNPCTCKGNYFLTPAEVSKLQRWLCQKRYSKFKILQEGYENIFWNAVFSSKQILYNGKTAGLELTLSTDAPYAYQDQVQHVFHVIKNEPFSFYDISDEIGSIYPDVIITIEEPGITRGQGKNITLENSMDNKVTQLNNITSGEIITIDGRNQILSSSIPDHNICNDFNWFFPKIINTYQNRRNDFTASLACKIVFSYFPIRKVGL